MTTIDCPSCNDASAVQIRASNGAAAQRRWLASCGACGHDWDFED